MVLSGINHIVLFTRSLPRLVEFYSTVLGLEEVERVGDSAVFLKVTGTDNHHDLGLIAVPDAASDLPPEPRVGLYHFAWVTPTFNDFLDARQTLIDAGVLVGESEHGNSLSVYSKDPDGNEFEVFWMLPRDEWTRREFGVRLLDIDKEKQRWNRN